MDPQLPISYREIVEELRKLNPTLLELAIEKVKSAKLSEALAEATKAEADENSGES